jgi:MFS transporter, DHA1 family, multidrug resistance protein
VFLVPTSLGFFLGNTTSRALAEVRDVSGSGSAWPGGAQFTVGALVSPLNGLGGSTTAVPFGLVLLGPADSVDAGETGVGLRRSRPAVGQQ